VGQEWNMGNKKESGGSYIKELSNIEPPFES
jgi:hypothetical protein